MEQREVRMGDFGSEGAVFWQPRGQGASFCQSASTVGKSIGTRERCAHFAYQVRLDGKRAAASAMSMRQRFFEGPTRLMSLLMLSSTKGLVC